MLMGSITISDCSQAMDSARIPGESIKASTTTLARCAGGESIMGLDTNTYAPYLYPWKINPR